MRSVNSMSVAGERLWRFGFVCQRLRLGRHVRELAGETRAGSSVCLRLRMRRLGIRAHMGANRPAWHRPASEQAAHRPSKGVLRTDRARRARRRGWRQQRGSRRSVSVFTTA